MTWLTILGMACITYLNRFVFLMQGIRYNPSDRLKRFLSFSSLAVLTAIWAPIVFVSDDVFSSQPFAIGIAGWDYLVATLVAIALSLARCHSLLVVVISAGLFFALRLYL